MVLLGRCIYSFTPASLLYVIISRNLLFQNHVLISDYTGYICKNYFLNQSEKCKKGSSNEQPRDKTNKMTWAPSEPRFSLGICTVWSVFTVHMTIPWLLSYPLSEDWSDWVDAQADLSLRWAHMSFRWFCLEVAQMGSWILFVLIISKGQDGISFYSSNMSCKSDIRNQYFISF